MADGTAFWKVFFGVLLALLVAGGCVVGGCFYLFGGAAVELGRKAAEEQDYAGRSMEAQLRDVQIERGFTYVRGSITNTGDSTVTYWKLAARFLDAKGRVIDTAFTNSLETLEPDASKNFEIMHRHDRRTRRVKLQIEEVRLR